jgi:hypothetical protein
MHEMQSCPRGHVVRGCEPHEIRVVFRSNGCPPPPLCFCCLLMASRCALSSQSYQHAKLLYGGVRKLAQTDLLCLQTSRPRLLPMTRACDDASNPKRCRAHVAAFALTAGSPGLNEPLFSSLSRPALRRRAAVMHILTHSYCKLAVAHSCRPLGAATALHHVLVATAVRSARSNGLPGQRCACRLSVWH